MTGTGRRERRRAETQHALLRAATELFGERGFTATSIADIAARADVGFGTVYGYFDSKEALLDAVVERLLDELAAQQEANRTAYTDPAERLAAGVRATIRWAALDAARARFITRFALVHDVLRTALGARLVDDVRQGVESGRFDATVARVAPWTIGGSVNGALRGRVAGVLGRDDDVLVASTVLRQLGLPAHEADEVARRSVPSEPPATS